ncbi:tripartite tricarboxylate transporter substrate-binding protein [Acrocarpospora macrocephala]|uniref:Tricarboxylate transporter n=1 Tax=Acrocarpospora macrocephala TaxID=150177 RepID=A0A5M3WML1_9ACTN|nr:tripartite tricarboxylate transporter substrate binding protein [Acrocarpospora macrocephala]GES09399.1 tricarboxylate transporter [Acrocarpospora macrocephala]
MKSSINRIKNSVVSRSSKALPVVLLGIVAVTSCGVPDSTAANPDNYPSKKLQWLVPYGSSSGADLMVRTMVNIINKYGKYPQPMEVDNVEGGSGATGYTKLYQSAGNPYVLSPTVSSTITVPLQADTVWSITDFTPVALMGRDDYVLAVKRDSPYKTLDDFLSAARKSALSVGGTSKVSAAFIFTQELCGAAGCKTNFVPFETSGTLTTGLLSDSLEAIVTNPGEISGQLRSGDIRALVFGGPRRLPQIPDVPTVTEAGYGAVDAYAPRGIVLPPKTDPKVQTYWVDMMKFIAQTPEWKEYLSARFVTSEQAYAADFGTRITELKTTYQTVLTKAGVL